jgi:hypothetical protein
VNLTQSNRVEAGTSLLSLAWVYKVRKQEEGKGRPSKRKVKKLYPFIKNGHGWMDHPRIVVNADGDVMGGPVFRLDCDPSLVLFGGCCRFYRGRILENLTTGKAIFDS